MNKLLTYDNVRLAHSSVCAIHDNADRMRDSAKCLENIICKQSEKGIVCLCSKTTTVLLELAVPKTMFVVFIQFYCIRNK